MYNVVGIGDSGINVLNTMLLYKALWGKPNNIDTIAINTHTAAFIAHSIDKKLLLNKSGLGTGGNPMRGREAAEASKDLLFDALAYTERVYITCGMGGGTGTGAAHVVAFVARELQIPTIAIVSTPFQFEGSRRKQIAELGVKALAHFADEVIVIDANKQVQPHAPEYPQFPEAMSSIAQSFMTLNFHIAQRILKHIENGTAASRP